MLQSHDFKSTYFFDTWQKKIIYIQPEMIVWLLVRNFFRLLQKKYQVKSWFREDKICLTGQVMANIDKAHIDIDDVCRTNTMDFIWRSEENDYLMDRVFSGFSVNQHYESLLLRYPLLLVIKRQKFRKVSLWLKNNGYSGLDSIYPVLPGQFVMIFAPKRDKEAIMSEIQRISNYIKLLLSNQITPGEETYFDLKGFSNYQIKKSFIYSSRLHTLSTMQHNNHLSISKTLTFCLDYDIKYFQEKFNVYLDFQSHALDIDKLQLRIHAAKDLDIFQAEHNMFQFMEDRITVVVDLENATQDEMMNKISLLFAHSTTKFFKSCQLTQMANAFDQFYNTSMLEALTAMDSCIYFISNREDSIPKLVIALDECNLNEVQTKINDFFETSQPLQLFDHQIKPIQKQEQIQSFETPTCGGDNEKAIDKRANYLCHQIDERVIDIVFYNCENMRLRGFTFDLVDFTHYLQKHYCYPDQVTPKFSANQLLFRVKFQSEILDTAIMQVLDRYINYEFIMIQKMKPSDQLITQVREFEATFWCDCEIQFVNQICEKSLYYPDDPDYEDLWSQVKNMNKGNKVCVMKLTNVGHSQRSKAVKAIQQIFSSLK